MIYKNDDGQPLYLFDRSRIKDAGNCPRLYFWRYLFMGTGIVPKIDLPPYWPFETGTFIHEGVEAILKGVSGRDAANKAANDYHKRWQPEFEAAKKLGEVNPELIFRWELELEQEVELVRGMVYGWYLVGLPRLLANYQVVEDGIEREESIGWILDGAVEMRLLTRTDIMVRNLITGGLSIINLKSTKAADGRWRMSYAYDMQTLTEAMAAENRVGVKIDGVIIEGLVKGSGSEWPKGSGFWQLKNELIYCWTKDSTSESLPGRDSGGVEFAASWDWRCTGPHVLGNGHRCQGDKDHTLGKGWVKKLASTTFMGGTLSWVDWLLRNEPAKLESYFVQLPPIMRDEFQVERWKRQKLHPEKVRQDAGEIVNAKFLEGNKQQAYELLDHYFDMNEGWGCSDCSYRTLCWEAGEPLDEQRWKPRIPNHLPEAEAMGKLVQIALKEGS